MWPFLFMKAFSDVIFVVWNSHNIFCKTFDCQRGLFNSLLFSKQPALHTETLVYNKSKLEYVVFASKPYGVKVGPYWSKTVITYLFYTLKACLYGYSTIEN